ncbi:MULTISPECIES: DNA replication/repair protein RecF [Erythrobacter]|uniref:DNA replication and repair protein RecF n=1 Tax=Erythrobacter aureus TaxID=2182384 RepID=A0A345YGN3_9SPHN|nr:MULTISPECIES: DNA replication/repair protein RecF [Erythrobacter]AXK43085.1 DNA replication/repair protein RecF [Erythrobacter aureus]MCF8881911.1 DNA replication/repair protein RecF [Erythrobacter sp. SN021]
MALDRISLTDFRNHAATELGETGQFNLLVGENGAGKTNILEALSLLAPGRGLRRAAMADMVRGDSETGFGVGASLVQGDETVRLGTYAESANPGRRRVRINGAETTATSLGEWLAITWLTPAMDGLFTGPASDRRRYMDRLALALDPAHATHAARYEAALRERNRLLSDMREPESAWLDAVEAQMIQHGSALMQGRARLVETLAVRLAEMPAEPFARPALTYNPGAPDHVDGLSQALYDNRGRDRAAQRTHEGPHRDELDVIHAAKRVSAAQSSTGEQKAMLVAMTLAHAGLAAQGRAGLLLLDEVAAHLDPLRRAALFEQLRGSGAQVWMTGTEPAPFSSIAEEAAIWRVSGGAVERV